MHPSTCVTAQHSLTQDREPVHQNVTFTCPPRWIERVNLKVRATCANPPEIRGRRVKDVHIFRACPGGESLLYSPTLGPKTSRTPKTTKPKPAHLNSPQMIPMSKARSKPRMGLRARPGGAKKTGQRRNEA